MRLENVEDLYPLAPLQQGLLFHSLATPEAGLYCNQALFALSGKLNVAAFELAWQRVVEHYSILRTSFVWDGVKEPVQVVNRQVELPFVHQDWRDKTPAEQQDAVKTILRDDLAQGFDLTRAPLLRVILLQMADDRHEFLWNFHHILLDGWSMFQVLKDAFALYDAFSQGQELQLTKPRPYRDYIAWLRRQSVPQAEIFWRRTLQGFTAPTPLVVDKSLEAHSAAAEEFASQLVELPAAVSDALVAMAQKNHLTLSTLLQGAWALLLSRYSGEHDIVFGAIVSGRPADLPGVETMTGLFINTLPVRAQIVPREMLLSWLRKFQAQQAEMRQYEYSSLNDVQSWSDAPRGMALFESIFMFGNYQKDVPLEEMSRTLEIGEARWFERQNYPLAAIAIPGRQMLLRLTYHCRRFETETISRLLGHWQALLESMIANPAGRIADLEILTGAERQQLLATWNDTALNYSRDRCAHELFEAQVKQRPDAIAVSHQGRMVTYHELNRCANQLAQRLQKMGVGPEVLVGICMERSLELVLASLAVLKAGGAYVPLDPAYPPERLAFMLQDSQVVVLLSKKKIVKDLKFEAENLTLIYLDDEQNGLSPEDVENLNNNAVSENLAYVIYTSGSTGKPKGVEIPHYGLVNLCAWHQEVYQITTADRATQFAAPAFDASVWEIWPYLTCGASLHIADEETLTNPLKLLQWLADEAISICFLPTPIAEAILEEPLPNALALRALLVGGDKLHRRPRQTLPFILANNYGPTENTVVTTWTPVDFVVDLTAAPPIGHPVANTQVYILDRALRPVPVGVPGELHISGESLARGYRQRPELTAEKFIPNPFDCAPGQVGFEPSRKRLYTTGDLTRYLPDGNIEFLGRIDQQVKIRGNRIELGEIETTLLQHPAVRETVCVASATPGTGKRLIAYVVTVQNSSTLLDELRQFLKEKLPECMLPSAFVFLPALPLTSNGKVDRQALPAPEQAQMESAETFVAPRTPLEKTLAEIWAEVLGAKKVGVHDNFFELGGDSILTIQIISRASHAGVKLTPKQLFTYPTIAELAEVADTARLAADEQGFITGTLPLTPIQRWFFAQDFVAPQHWNMAMLLEVSPTIELSTLQQVVLYLLNHHDALRLRFTSNTAGWQAHHAAVDNVAPVSRFDLSALPQGEQNAAMQERAAELQASLNLSQGPLLRFALFELGGSTEPAAPRSQCLLIIIHHLVVDGVSWRILLEDLATACRQIRSGEKIALPAKTTAFKHWAQRLTEHAQSAKLHNELDFWLTLTPAFAQRNAHDKGFHLPVDFAAGREANTMNSAHTISVALNPAETQALLQGAPKAYRTQIDDVLLTALVQTFVGWTGETSLFVHLEGHGREDILEGVDLSRTVGWFTTMYPVSLYWEAAGPGEALKAIKEQLRRVPQRGIGYGLLRYLGLNQSVSEKLRVLPVPEVSFNYLGQFDQGLTKSALFKIIHDETGPVCSPLAKRQHLLEVTAMVMQDCLQVEWMYSKNLHQQGTIENLAQNFVKALRALIEHCQNVENTEFTPSDFPSAKLSQQALDKLMGKIRQSSFK